MSFEVELPRKRNAAVPRLVPKAAASSSLQKAKASRGRRRPEIDEYVFASEPTGWISFGAASYRGYACQTGGNPKIHYLSEKRRELSALKLSKQTFYQRVTEAAFIYDSDVAERAVADDKWRNHCWEKRLDLA